MSEEAVPVGDPRVVLAIDTASGSGSVALRVGGRAQDRALEWRASFREMAPAIEGLMAESGIEWDGLDAIAVPSGPGSFTGLRVGAALALGLSRIAGRPLFGVPTLSAVAEAFAPPDARRVCATLDARRGRSYAALCARAGPGRWRVLAGPVDATPSEIESFAGTVPRVGPDIATGGSPWGTGLAAAVARLTAADPDHYATGAGGLELVYARPGVDPDERRADDPAAVEFRPCRDDDLDAVCEIESRTFPTPWSRDQFADLMAHPAGLGWVASLPGTGVAGYAIGWVVGDEAELADLAVMEALQGRGLGTGLVRAFAREAGVRGARSLYLEVRHSNQRARRFYAGLGFQIVGRRAGYYRQPLEDALVMRVDLPLAPLRSIARG